MNGHTRRASRCFALSWLAWSASVLALVMPLATGFAAPEAQQAETTEAKLSRANSFLGSQQEYPEAVRLYREILAVAPGHREARLRLAQVLSWSGELEASLREYAELRRRFPGDAEIRINQAEVLSWSGQTKSALEAFERILEQEPGNARAARGVARVLSWSGRKPQAERAYQRALALEEDKEARSEWIELRKTLRPSLELEANSFSDSSDFDRRDAWAEYSGFQDMATRVGIRMGWIQVSHPQDQVALAVRSPFDDDSGMDLGFVFDRSFDSGPKLTAEIGGRRWEEAGTSPYARFHLVHTFEKLGSVGAHLVHEEYGDVSNSFEAIQEQIRQTALAATLYRRLGAKLGAFGRLEVASLDDGNSRQSFYGALTFYPFSKLDADLSLGTNFMSFSDDSDSYYAPESDFGLDLLWQHRMPMSPALEFRYKAALGLQSTKVRSASESGTLWNAEAQIKWERDPWTARLRFGVSYSQRSSRYSTRRGLFELIREF